AIVSIGLFPLKAYLFNDGWQSAYAWGTLLFFIGIPVIGIITFIIRRIAKIKSKNNLMRWSFIALWLLGIVCFASLIVSVGRDFKSTNTIREEAVQLPYPGVNRLEVLTNSTADYYRANRFLDFQPFANFDEDTAYVNNLKIRITKSKNDSFKVTLIKVCNGRSRRYADTLASKIVYNINQVDSLLFLDKGIAINRQDKFRNQHVIITIAVPEGKVININKKLGWRNYAHFNGPWNGNDWDWDNNNWDDNEVNGWENHYGEDLLMKANGLYTLDGKRADKDWGDGRQKDDNEWDNDNENRNDRDTISGGYRYDETQRTIDSLQNLKERQMQKMKDSLKKVKDDIERSLEKLNESKTPDQQAFTPSFHDRRLNFFLHI
ncbi:MAG: hypothetical protein ABIR81_06565, partial [Ginsengibacter sp.]